MSEARTDTTDARPQEAEAGGAGKHRGGAARTEDYASPAHGKHRRPEPDGRTN
ncbi:MULTISPECIES: hypothetical protein [unclassified Streptomyces]|uniref:hypothetical protein n=1 Tax=unclassified Streptomyces TaxID=2593676 RepID=UPI0028C4F7AB|nr:MULTISPECIES: hypothetical protein [unclassified Streptomyces]WNO74876.1 hypothetical protein RPQ07_26140 [Streptomyces sp. AM8-1-1]